MIRLAHFTLLSTISHTAFANNLPRPDSSTIYTLLAILILALGLWLIWKQVKSQSTGQMSNTVVVFTGCAGLAIAACSFALSVSYGFTMGSSSQLLSLVFAMIFGAISIAEFVSAYWLERWLSSRNAFLFLVAGVLMAVGVMTSIIAGQALIASKIDEVKSQRVMASDAYQAAVAQRDNAMNLAQQLAISDSEYQSAVTTANRAHEKGKRIISSSNPSYSDCSAWPHALCSQVGAYKTKTNQLNQQLSSYFNEFQQTQLVIERYNQYQAANQRAKELLENPLPSATQAELPHVKWLSAVTGVDPELLEARLYITLAIIAEFVGLMLLFFYGEETRKTSLNSNFQSAQVSPLPSLNTGGLIHQDGVVEVHAGEVVLTKELSDQFFEYLNGRRNNKTTDPLNTTPPRVPSQVDESSRDKTTVVKKTTSRELRVCANPECSVEFVPRQYNHKFCSEECRIKGHGFQSKREMLKGIKRKQMK